MSGNSIKDQLKGIDPSAKDALFRRLMSTDSLSYLRHDGAIVGFEIELIDQNVLEGFAIIGIQKHTILAYRSDLGEEDRLVIFPTLEKLTDDKFGLLDLRVKRFNFREDNFIGRQKSEGILRDVARDLMPPARKVEISDEMADEMVSVLRESTLEGARQSAPEEAPIEEPDFDEPPMDEPDFDEPPMDTPVRTEKTLAAQEIKDADFTRMSDVSRFVIIEFGVSPDITANVENAVMKIADTDEKRMETARLIFMKMFNEGKLTPK